jgi:hypothetical protein
VSELPNLNPKDVKALENPACLDWVDSRFPEGPMRPDDEDYDFMI